MKSLIRNRWFVLILLVGLLTPGPGSILAGPSFSQTGSAPASNSAPLTVPTAATAGELPGRNNLSVQGARPCLPGTADPYTIHVIAMLSFDNNLSEYSDAVVERFRVGTALNSQVRATLLVDRAGDGNTTVLEIADGSVQVVAPIPWAPESTELDSANEQTLRDFLVWARTRHPGLRTLVTLLGHGAGPVPQISAQSEATLLSLPPLPQKRESTSWDLSSGTYLSTPELGRALREAAAQGGQPFDLLFFDQCFGGNLDGLYEVRGTAQVVIGSPNYAWAAFAYDRYLPRLDQDLDASAWAQAILEEYEAVLDSEHPNAIFWMRGTDVAPLMNAVSELGDALRGALEAQPQVAEAAILGAALEGRFVDTTLCAGDLELCPPDELVGLGTLATQLKARFPTGDGVATAAEAVLEQLAKVHGVSQSGHPWINPAATWGYTDTVTILAPLTRTLGTTLTWRHTVYTSAVPLTAEWVAYPTETVVISAPLAATVDGRWDDFLAAWYGPVTPTVGASCAVIPPVHEAVISPTLPLNLMAQGGLTGVRLLWNPTNSPDIAGYRVTRAVSGTAAFEPLRVTTDTVYLDTESGLQAGVTYCYRVEGMWPGGIPAIASNVACAGVGQLSLWVPELRGAPGTEIVIPVNLLQAEGLRLGAADLRLEMDGRVLEPISVTTAPLTQGYSWTLTVTQTGHSRLVRITTGIDPAAAPVLHGAGTLVWLHARVVGSAEMTTTLDLKEAGEGGSTVYTAEDPLNPVPLQLQDGKMTVGLTYLRGDVNGDGRVTLLDVYLVLMMATGEVEPTPEQLQAGDINQNGRMDAGDAAMILFYIVRGRWPRGGNEGKVAVGQPVLVSVDPVQLAPGMTTEMTVRGEGLTGWAGGELAFVYDPRQVTVLDVVPVELGSGFELEHRDRAGVLTVALAQGEPVSGDGALFKIRVRLSVEAMVGDGVPVVLARVQLNDELGQDFATSVLQRPVARRSGKIQVVRIPYQRYLPLVGRDFGESAAAPVIEKPPSNSDNWAGAIQNDLEQAEYQVSRQAGSGLYQAPNRAHNLRTYFMESGIRIVPRLGSGSDWQLDLALTGSGDAVLDVVGNRVEYRRPGLVEGYVNDIRGLEQGLALESAGQLPVLKFSGEPVLRSGEAGLEFVGPDGAVVLRSEALQAIDAAGRILTARMEPLPGGIRLALEDPAAVYPVTVRWRWVSPAGQPGINAADPDTIPDWTVEGAQGGASFAHIEPAGDVNGDGYKDVLIGAHYYDAGFANAGKVALYYGSATGLSATPAWTVIGDQLNGQLGFGVGGAGDVNGDGYDDVVVSANLYDHGETDEGVVTLYHGSPGGLSATPVVTLEINQAGAWFGGAAVASAGDVDHDGYDDVVIGARYYDGGQVDEGAVFVYYGSSVGLTAGDRWMLESNVANGELGMDAYTAGDVNGDGYDDVVAGAPAYYSGRSGGGFAYVFYGSSSGIDGIDYWMQEANQAGADFGASVSTAGDVNRDGYDDVLIGVQEYSNGQSQEGAVYLYYGSAAGLGTTPVWRVESNQVHAYYAAVRPAGDFNQDGYGDVVLGWPFFEVAGGYEGKVELYFGSATGLSATPDWTVGATQASEQLGYWVGTVGDVNRDGYDDLGIGSPLFDNDQTDAGKATVYYGGPASGVRLNTEADPNRRSR